MLLKTDPEHQKMIPVIFIHIILIRTLNLIFDIHIMFGDSILHTPSGES